jgi:NAD(P)-dependent dehydrogenase (short-subunit alcohol dehydrogenase family)
VRLSGKVAIITGAGAGQGREASVLFAAEGAKVIAADVNKSAADETVAKIRAAGGEAVALACDVADPEANRRMVTAVERWGGVHVSTRTQASSTAQTGDIGLETISPDTQHPVRNLTGVSGVLVRDS